MSSQTRKKTFYFSSLTILGLLLTSCTTTPSTSSSQTTSETTSNTTIQTSTTVDTSVDDTTSEQPTTGGDTTTTPQIDKDFQILSLNDFHGQVDNRTRYYNNTNVYDIGISKMSTFLKEKQEEMTTFVLSAGDMWQGSLDSNENHGQYITKAMNEIGFDAMSIGNHDFDWGSQYIDENSKIAKFPFLGCNIIDNKTKVRADWVQDSTIIEKDGIKLGVVGYIGVDQYSDISYSFIKDYTFAAPETYAIEAAKNLKNNGADCIVLLAHEAWSKSLSYTQQTMLNSGYFDLVFNGHSHTNNYFINTATNTPVVRGLASGGAYSYANFTLNKDDTLSLKDCNYHAFTSSEYSSIKTDAEIAKIAADYDYSAEKAVKLGTSLGTFYSNSSLAQFGAAAGYQTINDNEIYSTKNIISFVHNQARASLDSGEILYEDVYTSFPFNNELLIMNVKGYAINYTTSARYGTKKCYSLKSNYGVYPNNSLATNIDNNKYYTIAILDFVGYKIDPQYIENGDDGITYTGLFIRDAVVNKIKKDQTINPTDYN